MISKFLGLVTMAFFLSALAAAQMSCPLVPPPKPAKSVPACPALKNEAIAPGLTHSRLPWDSSGQSCVNALDLDLLHSPLRISARQAVGPCRKVSQLASVVNVVAAVNGGFFCFPPPSLCTYDSKKCPASCAGFSMLKMSNQLKSTNCSPGPHPILRTTLVWNYPTAPEISRIESGLDWKDISNAIGAGPTLVADGKVYVTDEGFPWVCSAHPRTAVGVTGDNHLILVTVDSPGVTLPDLAQFMIDHFHVAKAMNLDGGGSTTMVIHHKVVNHPSNTGGAERAIYDALTIEELKPVKPDGNKK